MKTSAFVATQPSPHRSFTQDSLIADDELGLYVVCDGMGAHAAGEVASSLACDVIRRMVEGAQDQPEDQLKLLLEQALLEACRIIFDYGQHNPAARGLGTTATVVVLRTGVCYLAHVGDSRAYLIREGAVNQLTRDHTVVNELVEQGIISPEEAIFSPYGHILTRALGCQPVVVVDTLKVDVLPGDRILVCSDGVIPGLNSYERVVKQQWSSSSTPNDLAAFLVQSSITGESDDDMTAIEIFINSCDCQNKAAQVTLTYEILSEMALFEQLEFAELAQIIEYTQVKTVKAGEVVIRKGTTGRDLYIILDGQVRVERGGISMTDISKGEHFGEISLLVSQPRAADVRALADTTLLELSFVGFQLIVEKDPSVGVKLLRALASQLCEQLSVLTEMVFNPTEPERPLLRMVR